MEGFKKNLTARIDKIRGISRILFAAAVLAAAQLALALDPNVIPSFEIKVLGTGSAYFSGKIDQEAVAQALRSSTSYFRTCYSDYLKRAETNPKSGQLMLSFTIGAHGKVMNVRVPKTDYMDDKGADCFGIAVKNTRFSDTGDEKAAAVRVNFPIEIKVQPPRAPSAPADAAADPE